MKTTERRGDAAGKEGGRAERFCDGMPARQEPRPLVGWSDYYAGEYTLPRICEHLRNMGHFIEKCRAHFGGRRILEVGTGTGIVSVYFSQLGYEVTGLDSDTAIVDRNAALNRQLNGCARYVAGDMFSMPFGRDVFDACYHQGLLEHFDRPQILAALHKQTEVARRVVFAVPTALWRGGLFGDERLWSGAEWRGLLGDFRVIDVFGGAYATFLSRCVGFAGRRFTRGRPTFLMKHTALTRAGEIGFVIERK